MMRENWATLWESVADATPDSTALVQGTRRIRWRELDDRAARLAAGLAALGAGKDSKIAILAYNCVEYLETSYAAFKLRATPVNLNYRYTDSELYEILLDCDAEIVVYHGELSAALDQVRGRLDGLKALVQIDAPVLLDGALDYEALVADNRPQERITRSGDDVFMLYTGGTTGRPRGVMWRHQDLVGTVSFPAYELAGLPTPADVAEAVQCALRLRDLKQSPVFLPASPLMHGTAFYLSQGALLLGGAVAMLEGRRLDAHEIWSTVQSEHVTQMSIVGDPFARAMTHALDEADEAGTPYDISSLERIVSSGVTWTAQWKQSLLDRGQMMLADIVGASEGGPFALQTITPGQRVEDCPWVMAPRAKLLRDDGSVIPEDSQEVGLLAVGPPTPLGYYKDPDKTAELLHDVDGVPHCVPGDSAIRNADGSVTFLGRGALCINTGGEKVYPREVEEAILTLPGVVDAAVVGVPDERWGEAVTALVVAEGDAPPSPDDVRTHVKGTLAGFKAPRHVLFQPELRRTPVGKLKYSWAREIAVEAITRDALDDRQP